MILKKMKLSNFRQFKGPQEIVFSNKEDGKVTVIFGENGRGKTGIYRALLFCLYGETRLSQDAKVNDKEFYLVNYPEMEANSEDNNPVEAYVELEFTHANRTYKLLRSILGMIDSGEVIQEEKGARLVSVDEDGNSNSTRDPNDINDIVGKILDKGLREYFLFDGEKIERLTRASLEQRKEISEGVRRLLAIDTLEVSMKAVKQLRKYFDSEVETRATGELSRVIKKLRENDENATQSENRVSEIDDELHSAEKEKKQVDEELDKIREIKDLLKDRNDQENKKEKLENQMHDLLLDMKNRIGKTALLLVRKTTNKVFKDIDKRKRKHEIPSEIRRDLIDRLISDGCCICGTPLTSGAEEHRRILEWRNRTTDILVEDSMLNLWRYLSGVNSHYEDIGVATESILQKYGIVKNDFQLTIRKLEKLRQQIGSSERADAAKLEKHRHHIERKILKLTDEHSTLRESIIELKEERELLQQQRKEIEKEQGIRDEMTKRSELAASTSDALKDIHEEFTGETRDQISRDATVYFRQLLDEEGKQTLRDIVVNSDYSIQVYDRWRKPFLANISAGQRQIISIAFIAALASAAASAGHEIMEMPLFMDTPFGRLSHEHRRNILKNVPNWCTQWILLATDTEFGRFEARILRETGQWNKFYILKAIGPGSTKIEAVEVNHVDGLLVDEAEVN